MSDTDATRARQDVVAEVDEIIEHVINGNMLSMPYEVYRDSTNGSSESRNEGNHRQVQRARSGGGRMSATDELRRLLDEQGIEYREYQPNPFEETTAWDLDVSDIRHEVYASFEEFGSGSTLLRFWNCTPEQAVAATMGKGTCRNVHEPPRDATFWPAPHFKCSRCGATYVSTDYAYYCPSCGRKVRDE
jgi:hypothetical protein